MCPDPHTKDTERVEQPTHHRPQRPELQQEILQGHRMLGKLNHPIVSSHYHSSINCEITGHAVSEL